MEMVVTLINNFVACVGRVDGIRWSATSAGLSVGCEGSNPAGSKVVSCSVYVIWANGLR